MRKYRATGLSTYPDQAAESTTCSGNYLGANTRSCVQYGEVESPVELDCPVEGHSAPQRQTNPLEVVVGAGPGAYGVGTFD